MLYAPLLREDPTPAPSATSIELLGFPLGTASEWTEFKILWKNTSILKVVSGGTFLKSPGSTQSKSMYAIETGLDGTSSLGTKPWEIIHDYDNDGDYGDKIELVAEPYYEPVTVHVGNNKAKNITDYFNPGQPAFASTPEGTLQYQYLQMGRKLYFSKPTDETISVKFRYKTAYTQLVATLRNTPLGGSRVTTVIDSYKLAMKTARR